MKSRKILIKKSSGNIVPYSENKVRNSLQRVGADDKMIKSILNTLRLKVTSGMSTKQIYKIAFSLLKSGSREAAGRYHLKQGIMELGPSGFPFEQFFAKIIEAQGYLVKTDEIVKGKCVIHEIDVVAMKGNDHFMIECKFHNMPGTVSDVKVPLYIQSRFIDVEDTWVKLDGHASKFHQGWVVTNTRFTSDAIQYGLCAGLRLISWDYPEGKSLRDQIDQEGLYPLTCLTTLSRSEKQLLLGEKVVLCKDLGQNKSAMLGIGISPSRIEKVLKESQELCMQVGNGKG